MDCPKCRSEMQELTTTTLQGEVTIDRCTECGGLWFDHGEAEILKDDWMSEFMDSGDPKVGREHNTNTEIDCPRCGKQMKSVRAPRQSHIEYEVCEDHGMFMDAGEFSDYKHENLLEWFADAILSATSKLRRP